VINPPRSTAELDQTMLGYRLELVRTPAAAQAADLLLHQPPLPALSRPAYHALASGALLLLPAWALARLRLPYRPLATQVLLTRPLAAAAMKTLRWAFAADPVVRAGN